MITIAETRALLGRLADGKSDAQIDAMRHDTYTRLGQLRAAYVQREMKTTESEVRREKRKGRR